MLRHWKKILIIFIVVVVVYSGCSTKGILRTETFFRAKNPKLALTPKVCYMLGTAAFRSFRYGLAVEIISRNLKDFPYESAATNAQYRRAIAYEKLGRYNKAIQMYENFMYDNPKDNRLKSVKNKVIKLKALHQEQ